MSLLLRFPLLVLFTIGLSLLFSLPTYWLWNELMPDIFHLPTITWLQAWGLLLLSGCLFKKSDTTPSKNND